MKRIHGGPWRKIAATPELLTRLAEDLDLDDWDDFILALAVSMVLVFLMRSCEALRKGWPRTQSSACE